MAIDTESVAIKPRAFMCLYNLFQNIIEQVYITLMHIHFVQIMWHSKFIVHTRASVLFHCR